jgi:hypothetical protein
VAGQHPGRGVRVEHELGIAELVQHAEVRVHAHRFLREPDVHGLGLRPHESALARDQPQHEQFVVLAGVDTEGAAGVPVRHDPREQVVQQDGLLQSRGIAGLQGVDEVAEESLDVGFAHGMLALGARQWTRRKAIRVPRRPRGA